MAKRTEWSKEDLKIIERYVGKGNFTKKMYKEINDKLEVNRTFDAVRNRLSILTQADIKPNKKDVTPKKTPKKATKEAVAPTEVPEVEEPTENDFKELDVVSAEADVEVAEGELDAVTRDAEYDVLPTKEEVDDLNKSIAEKYNNLIMGISLIVMAASIIYFII